MIDCINEFINLNALHHFQSSVGLFRYFARKSFERIHFSNDVMLPLVYCTTGPSHDPSDPPPLKPTHPSIIIDTQIA